MAATKSSRLIIQNNDTTTKRIESIVQLWKEGRKDLDIFAHCLIAGFVLKPQT